jgi:hypothetical protein
MMNETMVYRGELGEANSRSLWQTDLGPTVESDIRLIARRMCGHTGNHEINIAADEHQPRPVFMGLRVEEGIFY